MINYELAKQLKDAGFVQNIDNECLHPSWCTGWEKGNKCTKRDQCQDVTLSELIEECGKTKSRMSGNIYKNVKQIMTFCLEYIPTTRCWVSGFKFDGRYAFENSNWEKILRAEGKTPEEAVAKLWLELHEK